MHPGLIQLLGAGFSKSRVRVLPHSIRVVVAGRAKGVVKQVWSTGKPALESQTTATAVEAASRVGRELGARPKFKGANSHLPFYPEPTTNEELDCTLGAMRQDILDTL